MKILLITSLGCACFAAEFETGVVVQSDGGAFHRNTIPQVARLGDGRLMAVLGVYPKSPPSDTRIATALSTDSGRTWSPPRILYQEKEAGREVGDPNMLVDGNTVFVYWTRASNPNTIKKSWTWAVKSTNNGETWSEPQEIMIPRQYTPGKQHNAIKLADGTYAMGISWDRWPEHGLNARTEGEMNLSSGLLLSKDGLNWNLYGDLHVFVEKVTPYSTNGLAEPSIVQLESGEIFMLLRSGTSRHYEARSRDGGVTWSRPVPSSLVGHNTPAALWRLANSKEIVAVWNNSPINRFPLCAALSADGGRSWSPPRVLANSHGPQVSYPGLTQAADGTIIAVWQAARDDGGRDVRYAKFTRNWILGGAK
jgi:hypothetical protein